MSRVTPHWPAIAPIVAGQVAFVGLMTLCIAMQPSREALERGLSFYGNDLATGIPFGLAIVTSGVLTWVALRRLRPRAAHDSCFRRGTTAVVALTLLIPFTPYRASLYVDYLHVGLTGVVFASALGLGLWIAWRLLRYRAAVLASAAQLAAALVALSAQPRLDALMIPAEIVFEVAFGLLVAFATARVARAAA
jgi:hypothetical protein